MYTFLSSIVTFQYKYDDVRSPAKAAVEGGFGLSASDKLIAVPSPVGGASGAALMFVPVDNTQINRLQVQNLFSLHVCNIFTFSRYCLSRMVGVLQISSLIHSVPIG